MSNWKTICKQQDLSPDTGVCALHENQQIAIFYCKKNSQIYGLDNYCPFGKANVLSRGIIGSIGEDMVVASPLYKQHFTLTGGQCLEDPSVSIKTYALRINGDDVQIAA